MLKAVYAFYADLAILVFVQTLREPVKEFIKQVHTTSFEHHSDSLSEKKHLKLVIEASNANVNLALRQYESLQELSNRINYFIGPTLLFYLGEMVLTYGLHFTSTVLDASFLMRTVVALFYICVVSICYFAADIPRQVSTSFNLKALILA